MLYEELRNYKNEYELVLIPVVDVILTVDVILQKSGIIQLQPHCKGCTNLFMIETVHEVNKNATY